MTGTLVREEGRASQGESALLGARLSELWPRLEKPRPIPSSATTKPLRSHCPPLDLMIILPLGIVSSPSKNAGPKKSFFSIHPPSFPMLTALPPSLQAAIDELAYPIHPRDLAAAADRLSAAYRERASLPALDFGEPAIRAAYAVVRMPGTYAAVCAAIAALQEQAPAIAPSRLLDIGCGPGTALWAAWEFFPSLREARCVDRNAHLLGLGSELWQRAAPEQAPAVSWERGGALMPASAVGERTPLVTAAFVLNELPPGEQGAAVTSWWDAAGEALLIVEPGTMEGFAAILRARDALLRAGAHIAAPCSHAGRCPLEGRSWCHFSARFPRTPRHRVAKGGTLGYEDEKFAYLAALRTPLSPRGQRILMTPQVSKATAELLLCTPDQPAHLVIPRKEKAAYKRARKADWGDLWVDEPEG